MSLSNKIAEIISLSKEGETWLAQNSRSFSFKKNEVILHDGELCNYLYYVNQGIISGSYLEDHKEVCSWIALKDDFATSYYSFITQKTSSECIMCLEDCLVEALSYTTLNTMYTLFPETERAGRLILEEYYTRLEEHSIAIRSKTAKERYLLLLKSRPDLIKFAPLGRIASYLGMSQETLSRIRASI